MNRERWQQVKQLLAEAIAVDEAERPAFLDRACQDDAELRREVESLLSSHDQAGTGFLKDAVVNLSDQAAAAAPARERRIGAYEIAEEIGHGGMGEVYRARDTRLRRDVAIKVLPGFLAHDAERLRRFEQEAQAAAALNHPNILAVFQMGTFESAPYLVSELLDGRTLREEFRRGPLPVRKVIDYGAQIARGLAAAHDKGIVHRDLKPENLFITNDGRAKILDFGLAKLTQRRREEGAEAQDGTDPGMVMGCRLHVAGTGERKASRSPY